MHSYTKMAFLPFSSDRQISETYFALQSVGHCNCIVTRGGVYDEILPEPEGNHEGGARGIS